MLQKTVQTFLKDTFDLDSVSLERTGVWIPPSVSAPSVSAPSDHRKIAFIGLHVQRWITSHGISINFTRASTVPFADIIVCGERNEKVTCIETETVAVESKEPEPRYILHSEHNRRWITEAFVGAFSKASKQLNNCSSL